MALCVPDDIITNNQPAASPIRFEGVEKRLEISFTESPPILNHTQRLGLRALTRTQLNSILEPACCTIVSHLSNAELDSYVLSESSLFIYPHKIILKTCGTTRLLLSIHPILRLADSLSLSVLAVKYSRGEFLFPNDQHTPHRSFSDEVVVLKDHFSHLGDAKYFITAGPNNRNWHVYFACREDAGATSSLYRKGVGTVEICMTGLDREKARVFFKGNKMTEMSRVAEIIPGHAICGFEFDPCGYSMNGIEGTSFSTVHVTPEDGFSYASYEVEGLDPGCVGFGPLLNRVLWCFGPCEFSVAVTCEAGAEGWATWRGDVEGYRCENVVKEEMPGKGCLLYMSFSSRGCAGSVMDSEI
ncbi:S-adenosylmethionine decarboxylase proenzyme-like [Lotus japonicus]|uniref:S-adenosylmethionine decarboxylase proenzyme-like n=1 Tax=Lotus japonicus TaxID=34305 RepID=UPI0025860835|nr:S-adenosylmethionine decarboxylase proenzyme-like [Lotus japonicus]